MPLEATLLAHPAAQTYFQGKLYDNYGPPLTELNIHHAEDQSLRLDATTTGRLCMIPDGSMVTATRIDDRSDAPPQASISTTAISSFGAASTTAWSSTAA